MLLRRLIKATEALDKITDIDELIRQIPQLVCECFGLDRSAFYTPEGNKLRLKSAHTSDDPEVAKKLVERASEMAVELDKTQPEWRTLTHKTPFYTGKEVEGGLGTSSCQIALELSQCIIAPVVFQGQPLGLVAAGSTKDSTQDLSRLSDALELFSQMVAHSVQSLALQDAAGQAIGRARRRVAELSAHEQITSRLRSATSVLEILRMLIDEIHNIVDYDYAVAVAFENGEEQWVSVSRGPDDNPIPNLQQRLSGLSREELAAALPMITTDPSSMPPSVAALPLKGSRSVLHVPMQAGDMTIGFVILGSRGNGLFTDSDLRFTSTASETATVIIDNLRLYSRAIKSEERMRTAFAQVGAALGSGLDLTETLRLIVQISVAMIEADAAALLICEADSDALKIRASDRLSEEFSAGAELPIDKSFTKQTIESKRRTIYNDTKGMDVDTPKLDSGKPVRSLMSVPIILSGRLDGVIEVYSSHPNYFSPNDLDVLGWLSGHAAIAMGNVEAFRREKNIAEAFQSSMMIVPRPISKDFEVAAKYSAALEEARVGGDFYDFIPLLDGKLGVVIGDVSGKGLQAAVYTAMGKYMLRAYAAESPSPSSVLKRLNNAMCRYGEHSLFITLFYGIIDPETQTIVHSSAGHEPPLLISDKGRRLACECKGGAALGVIPNMDYPEGATHMKPGATMLLYTDGATEAAKNRSYMEVEGLAKLLRRHRHLEPSRMVEEIYQSVREYSGGRLRDDVVLVAIRRKVEEQDYQR